MTRDDIMDTNELAEILGVKRERQFEKQEPTQEAKTEEEE
jgi:hypothetical protein